MRGGGDIGMVHFIETKQSFLIQSFICGGGGAGGAETPIHHVRCLRLEPSGPYRTATTRTTTAMGYLQSKLVADLLCHPPGVNQLVRPARIPPRQSEAARPCSTGELAGLESAISLWGTDRTAVLYPPDDHCGRPRLRSRVSLSVCLSVSIYLSDPGAVLPRQRGSAKSQAHSRVC